MIYCSDDQAEVYRFQFKMRHRKKGKTLTDLAQEIRKLMVRTYPGPPNKTTQIVARDAFLEALDDAELVIHIQAQKPDEPRFGGSGGSAHGGRTPFGWRQIMSAGPNFSSETRTCEVRRTNQSGLNQSEPDAERLAGIDKENSGGEQSTAYGLF